MLAISTPSPEGNMVSLQSCAALFIALPSNFFLLTFLQNFYQNMMDARDPNDASKTMFKVLQISLACPACMEAGRASECTHMEKFRPPWSKLKCCCLLLVVTLLLLTFLDLHLHFQSHNPSTTW